MRKSANYEVIPLAARTATGNHDLGGLCGDWDNMSIYVNVTAASGTSPTLDISYQTTPDGGTTWFTHTSFTQATGVATEKKTISSPIGNEGRILYTVGGTSPSFTFKVNIEVKRHG